LIDPSTQLRPGPFAQPGRWFKGSLHIHSTGSDGVLTPDEVIDWHRERGYHFIAITDHEVLSLPTTVSDDFITLGGTELEGVDPISGLYHLVGLGLRQPLALEQLWQKAIPIQETTDRLRAAGARVFLAHPYWSGQMSKDLLDLQGCFGMEVYNGACEADTGKEYSLVHWDDLLAAGRHWWGVAADDAHWRQGDNDAGRGWVWVKAPELTQTAILDSLEQGRFYASSGPRILDFWLDVDQRTAHARCDPSVKIDFTGNGKYLRRMTAPAGETMTGASHRLWKRQTYVRVACQDTSGRWAWSNPIFLDS
jgi:hypothetical protein